MTSPQEAGTNRYPRPAVTRAEADQVWRELSVNDRCSELNRPQAAMQRGAQALGWSFTRAYRNWDPGRHDPTTDPPRQ